MNVSRAAPRLHGHINETRELSSQIRMKDESGGFPLVFLLFFSRTVYFTASVGLEMQQIAEKHKDFFHFQPSFIQLQC